MTKEPPYRYEVIKAFNWLLTVGLRLDLWKHATGLRAFEMAKAKINDDL